MWQAILEFLRREGAAGATVIRGAAGYGATSKIHKVCIVDLAVDLPLLLEWVDTQQRLHALLPRSAEMLPGGMITTDPVTAHSYRLRAPQP